VDDKHVQVLADRIASGALASHPRLNALIRWGDRRGGGALAVAAVLIGGVIATGGVYRRVTHSDVSEVERLYAQTAAVDRDRAHADVHYVHQRLRLLALATADDPWRHVRDAAPVLVTFVAAGRPTDQRLDDVEAAFAPLREASDDRQPTRVVEELLPAYLAAWRNALRWAVERRTHYLTLSTSAGKS
jgi:hypothetical protein